MSGDNQLGTMLTVKEVSKMLHVHSNTLRRWSDQGIIKAYRIGPRGDRRFKINDIITLLEKDDVNLVLANIQSGSI